MRQFIAVVFLLLAGCAGPGPVPDFATKHFEPFNRADTVALALREWRLFGSPMDPVAAPVTPQASTVSSTSGKPERDPGLWQRVGDYWWEGLGSAGAEHAWTGKHDSGGHVFPADKDAEYAWSAAFISYIMRVAGAGDRFPYSPNHSGYVNAAAAGRSSILQALAPGAYAPVPGDLICHARGPARGLHFEDLPTGSSWPGHCAIVVGRAYGQLAVIGGNVNDAVSMTYVPTQADGRLFPQDDPRAGYPWFVVLRVLYDAESEPAKDR